jgi:hypothetical protein
MNSTAKRHFEDIEVVCRKRKLAKILEAFGQHVQLCGSRAEDATKTGAWTRMNLATISDANSSMKATRSTLVAMVSIFQRGVTKEAGKAGLSRIHHSRYAHLSLLRSTKSGQKRKSIFTFALPVYSNLPATHHGAAPLPIPEPGDNLQTVLDGAHVRIELHGNWFCFRSADRAGRKFKAKESIKL